MVRDSYQRLTPTKNLDYFKRLCVCCRGQSGIANKGPLKCSGIYFTMVYSFHGKGGKLGVIQGLHREGHI